MYRKPAFRLAAVILALLVASSAWAGTTGKIAGKVLDRDSGEPLPGVSILIKGTTTGAATNIQGEFFIINVRPGEYDLRATLVGYGPVEIQSIRVSLDLTTSVDFDLSTETIDMGTITVEAERPLIEKDITSSRTTIAGMQITNSAIDGIVGAVNFTAGSVLGSFRGGRADQGEVIYMLDGVSVANPIGETRVGYNPGMGSMALATVIPNEAISEAEVLTGGFGAEYPNVQSAIVNIVSKEGGDKYSGKIKSKSSPEVIFGRDNMEDETFNLDWAAPGSTVVLSRPTTDDTERSDFYDMRQHEFSFGGPVPVSSLDLPGEMSFYTSGIYAVDRSYEDQRGWNKSQSVQGKITYKLSSSKKLTMSGLKSKGSELDWARSRMMSLTWGEPAYFHRSDVSIATGEVVIVDTFWTPYNWIMAPGHSEFDIPDDLTDYWTEMFGNENWDADSVNAFFSDTLLFPAGASGFAWGDMPDTLLGGAADYIEGLGYARRYTDYDMGRTLGKQSYSSSQYAVKFTNNVSTNTFYSIGYSFFESKQSVRQQDPWDGHPLSAEEFLESRFVLTGVDKIMQGDIRVNPMYLTRVRQDDRAQTHSFRGDITSQVNSNNLAKFGVNLNYYDLFYEFRSLASGDNAYNSFYDVNPFQVGFYAQDKIETEGMIVNVGMRYDYFDPRTFVPWNPLNPVNPIYSDDQNPEWDEVDDTEARLNSPIAAKKKQQLSPRLGVSYPITEKDVLHVTYGHYFQLPVFDDFYTNHAYDLRGQFDYIGNPNLSEQKTISYEAGIVHGFNDYMKVAVTGFYKDISDLTSYRRDMDEATGDRYYVYVNTDYARVKGFELTLTQRPWHNFSGAVTYTFQIARGRASDKTDRFLDDYLSRKPRTEDFYLDWDQRNTAKANLNYRIPATEGTILGDWGFDLAWSYGSGEPYTSTENVTPPNLPPINDQRFPVAWQIDLRVDKGLDIYKHYNLNAFVEIRNVTDEANIIDAIDLEKYGQTGNPAGQYGDPSVYSAPRRILLGMQLSF